MKIQNLKIDEKTFFFIALAITLFVRIRLCDIAMERDEGEYAYAGWQILRGALPYADFYNMKFPGVYYFYALIFKLFGTHIIAVRLSVMALNLSSGFFVYALGKKWLGQQGAWLASGIFLLLSVAYHGQGFISNCEHFVVFFYLLGLWLLSQKSIFSAGLCLGIACLMKQHAAILALFAGFMLVNDYFKTKNVKILIAQFLSLGIGFLLPLIGLLFFILQKNIFSQFYYFTFEYAAAYSKLNTFNLGDFTYSYAYICFDNIGFWLIFWVTVYHIFKNRKLDLEMGIAEKGSSMKGNFILLFWLISFISICPGWYFRAHYYQFIFPASALVMAYGLSVLKIEGRIKNFKFNLSNVLIMSLLCTFIVQSGYFFFQKPSDVSRYMYRYDYFSEIKDFSKKLGEISKPDDKIGVLSTDPQIFFYAQRQQATGFLYLYPLLENQKFASEMTEKLIAETEANKPEWLISFYIPREGNNPITTKRVITWFDKYAQNYSLKAVMYSKKKYFAETEWDNPSIDTSRKNILYLYQRRD